MTRSHVRRQTVLLSALLSAVVLAGPSASAVETAGSSEVTSAITADPVITGAACTGGELLMVTGEGFTPGGQVDVEIAGLGTALRPSQPVFGPNGSADPALGFHASGLADLGNSNAAMIRSVRASQSFFGPNGSTDPALGFQRGGFVGITLEHGCAADAMVQAYDRQLAVWSNQVLVELG